MEFVVIATAHFMALVSPGPDFFLILQTALRLPSRYAMALCLGIASANGVYILCAILGHASLAGLGGLLPLLRCLGGAYLLYLGIMLLKAPRCQLDDHCTAVVGDSSLVSQFRLGFIAAILNPKNLVFYLSLFTSMVSEATPVAFRLAYGAWMFFMVLFWDLGIAMFLGHGWIRKRYSGALYPLEKASGTMLALFGILLPFY